MNIAFCCQHPYYGGLNNNGGSQTIVHSCNILSKLGHKAVIVTKWDRHTWVSHKRPVSSIPKDTDICIACSVSDIGQMLKRMPKNAKAFWWCRLREDYQMSKSKILRKARKVEVLVNSEGLQAWFNSHGNNSRIVYQGYDHKWKDVGKHSEKNIGFLISGKKRKNFDVVKKIVKLLGPGYNYYGFGTNLNGDIKRFLKNKFKYFVENAGYSDIIKIYNSVSTWVSTSTSEGLHNCPLEAALCGCNVVYPNALLAGCSDHCIDGLTAWEYKALDAGSAVGAILKADGSRVEEHQDLIKSKINDRKINMIRLIEILEKETKNGVVV